MTAKDDSTDADIDPLYGDVRPSANSIPEDVPDHEVALHIADPLPEEQGPLFHFEPSGLSILIQRENPALSVRDKCSDACCRNRGTNSALTNRGAICSHLAGTEFLRTHRKYLIFETPEIGDFWGRE